LGIQWGAAALGAAGGAVIVLLAVAAAMAAGLLVNGTDTSPAMSTPSARETPALPNTSARAPSASGSIPVFEQAQMDLPVGPELPVAIDLTPLDVPWAGGDSVTIAGAAGANLRPYPVTDDSVAAPSLGLPQGAEVQIVSTFRVRMGDGNWWYVRIPGSSAGASPMFGWMREDLLLPAEARAATE
jgi:hypothetical protein